jgi:tripartite-type tricarboxylate transporter receptor subunit TctC
MARLPALLLLLLSTVAQAQDWPTKPVKFIVPAPPGMAPDIISRLLTDKLVALWGRQVIVENLLAVTNTPPAIIERVNRDINTVIQMPEIVARFAELGVYPTPGSVKDAANFMRAERELWAKVVRDAGIKPQ